MKKRTSIASVAALALTLASSAVGRAGELSTAPLTLHKTMFKTVGAPGEVITLPACPTEKALFTAAYIPCPTNASTTQCVIEANVSSEVSDVSGSVDSIRFKLYIDGSPVGVNPSVNVGVQSTAHAGQIETATMSWMKNQLAAGTHRVEARACVNDTDGGGASAYAGDCTLTVRSYLDNW